MRRGDFCNKQRRESSTHPFIPRRETGQSIPQKHGKRVGCIKSGVCLVIKLGRKTSIMLVLAKTNVDADSHTATTIRGICNSSFKCSDSAVRLSRGIRAPVWRERVYLCGSRC